MNEKLYKKTHDVTLLQFGGDDVDYKGHAISQMDAMCIRHLKDGDMFWVCGGNVE